MSESCASCVYSRSGTNCFTCIHYDESLTNKYQPNGNEIYRQEQEMKASTRPSILRDKALKLETHNVHVPEHDPEKTVKMVKLDDVLKLLDKG